MKNKNQNWNNTKGKDKFLTLSGWRREKRVEEKQSSYYLTAVILSTRANQEVLK